MPRVNVIRFAVVVGLFCSRAHQAPIGHSPDVQLGDDGNLDQYGQTGGPESSYQLGRGLMPSEVSPDEALSHEEPFDAPPTQNAVSPDEPVFPFDLTGSGDSVGQHDQSVPNEPVWQHDPALADELVVPNAPTVPDDPVMLNAPPVADDAASPHDRIVPDEQAVPVDPDSPYDEVLPYDLAMPYDSAWSDGPTFASESDFPGDPFMVGEPHPLSNPSWPDRSIGEGSMLPGDEVMSKSIPDAGWNPVLPDSVITEMAYLTRALSTPIQLSDLAMMGERVASFARLLEVLVSDPTLDKSPALDLFRQHFPWWHPSFFAYQPWYSDAFENAAVSEHVEMTGYVMCVNNDNFDTAAHTISALRKVLESRLPFEIAYAGDEDLSPAKRAILSNLEPDLEMVDLTYDFDIDVVDLLTAPWSLKPFAALSSRFSKVILIDADVVFLHRPDAYFELHGGLKETGALYFHDRATNDQQNRGRVFELLQGRKPSPELEQSLFWQGKAQNQQAPGLVFIDKSKPSAFMSLVLTNYLSTREVASWLEESNFEGDKEIFWLASELSSAPYTFSPTYAGLIGNLETIELPGSGQARSVCSRNLLHLGLESKPLWFTSGLRRQDPWNFGPHFSFEFATFTHWVKSGSTQLSQPRWTTQRPNAFCVIRDEKVEKLPSLVNGLMRNMRSRAVSADEKTLAYVDDDLPDL